MKLPRSIRWRIQLWHGLLLFAVVAGAGITIYRIQLTNLTRISDVELDARLLQLMGALRDNLGPPPRPGDPPPRPPELRPGEVPIQKRLDAEVGPFYFVMWGRRGAEVMRGGSAPRDVPYPTAPSRNPIHRRRGDWSEAYVFNPMGVCVLVGRPSAAKGAEIQAFGWQLFGLGAAVMVLGLSVGSRIAARAIRPIQEIGSAAARISGGNLSARIAVRETESELGQLAAVLNDMFSRLEEAFLHEARFSSDAAHELRTPVSVLLAQTQLALESRGTPEEMRETIMACRRAALRMHGLIESLLDLAMVEGRLEGLKKAPGDLAEIAQDGIEITRLLASERLITLTVDLQPAPCLVDGERILQVLLNLLTNAVKFSGPDSEIRVTTATANGHAVLKVRDSGQGIDAVHVPHLFERFYRVDSSRTRSTGGVGLGLAISRSIVVAHEGTIEVESRVGEGSTFTIKLPVR